MNNFALVILMITLFKCLRKIFSNIIYNAHIKEYNKILELTEKTKKIINDKDFDKIVDSILKEIEKEIDNF